MDIVTESEKKLIKLLKDLNIDKDDGIGISIISRDYNKTDEMIDWIEKNNIKETEKIFDHLGELCNLNL